MQFLPWKTLTCQVCYELHRRFGWLFLYHSNQTYITVFMLFLFVCCCSLFLIFCFSLAACTVDQDTIPASLVSAVENDDSPLSFAYSFLAASRIPDADLSVFFDQIEDVVAQADETSTTLYVSCLKFGDPFLS